MSTIYYKDIEYRPDNYWRVHDDVVYCYYESSWFKVDSNNILGMISEAVGKNKFIEITENECRDSLMIRELKK